MLSQLRKCFMGRGKVQIVDFPVFDSFFPVRKVLSH